MTRAITELAIPRRPPDKPNYPLTQQRRSSGRRCLTMPALRFRIRVCKQAPRPRFETARFGRTAEAPRGSTARTRCIGTTSARGRACRTELEHRRYRNARRGAVREADRREPAPSHWISGQAAGFPVSLEIVDKGHNRRGVVVSCRRRSEVPLAGCAGRHPDARPRRLSSSRSQVTPEPCRRAVGRPSVAARRRGGRRAATMALRRARARAIEPSRG
jgi:hypothetical protein